MSKNKPKTLEVPVTFGGFSDGGKKTARLGISIGKEDMTPTQAEAMLCNSRLAVIMKFDPNDQGDAEQQTIGDISEVHIRTVADCKGYHSAEQITAGLTFMRNELGDEDLLSLHNITGKSGTLVMERTGTADADRIVNDDGDEDEDEDGDESEQPRLAMAGA